jgi:hypothetical protein
MAAGTHQAMIALIAVIRMESSGKTPLFGQKSAYDRRTSEARFLP